MALASPAFLGGSRSISTPAGLAIAEEPCGGHRSGIESTPGTALVKSGKTYQFILRLTDIQRRDKDAPLSSQYLRLQTQNYC